MKDLKKITPDEIKNDEKNLYIKWKDGVDSAYSLLELRKNCPCAVCRGGHEGNIGDATGHITSINLKAWAKVGRYALAFEWSDSHNDGIYPFELLREFAEDSSSKIVVH